ncbi:MAG: hypothetical protein IKU25_07655 [Clostridia bacterium]|nr:hypothetical protein [Clostridia bacterium]
MVAFQAVPTVKNGKVNKSYNYTKFLKDINVNRLFIEDTCGEFGCYYLCNNMNFDVEETVIALIESIMKKYKIKKENVITFGSSKGGSAALYYGLKYRFGHIISGAPQTRIATYLGGCRPKMLQYIAGDDLKAENLEFLDSLIINQVRTGSNSKINLLTSKNDAQYECHIVPLLEKIKKTKQTHNIVFQPEIKKHRDIATFFPNFLIENVQRIINEKYNIVIPEVKLSSKSIKFVTPMLEDGLTALIEITSGKGDTIEKMSLTRGDKFEFCTDEIISYTATYSVCLGEEPLYSTTLCDSVFDQGYFKYHGYSMTYNDEQKTLDFKIDVDPIEPTSYAFTLIKGKDILVPPFHSDEPFTSFPISESGTYVVRFAIKVKGEGITRKSTERYPIAID